MKRSLLSLILLFISLSMASAHAAGSPPLSIQLLSSKSLSGTAGDFVTVRGQITNTGLKSLDDVTTYLSLMDNQNKLPVDLEDWSAEKGLYIGAIGAGQTLPLNWKIHFVKAGTYSLIIVAEAATYDLPQVSSITQFSVSPKRNLNPGDVLPVALGTPIVLIFILFLLVSKRRIES
ncbi:hypothetical protein M1506_03005 [Patescibacteria group bacterium]|nr:hypothetical protein [Patescibacteria group bacterium]